MATKKQIDEFLSCKRIAVIGMSRTKLEYSRMLMDEYKSGGYEIIPINPAADEIAGVKCYKNIKDVWLHSHIAAGVQNTKAIYQAEANKMNLITGHCPMMFLHKAMFLHKLHGGVLQLIGAYPK
jgi:predicted CoA-binding protein